MSKELKAFKKLREQNDFLKERNIPKEFRYDDELDIIENALKENVELKKMIRNFNEAIGEPQIITPTIEKKLKALEIIQDEFKIYFDDKKQAITIQSVERPYTHIRFSLTREIKDKEKYELLKEMLL